MKAGTEIERKYLVKNHLIECTNCQSRNIRQTYIYLSDKTEIRVRSEEEKGNYKYSITVKRNIKGSFIIRKEYEMKICKKLYNILLKRKVNGTHTVEKTRYIQPLENGLKAEVDFYKGVLLGLKTVEVEFNSLSEMNSFEKPEWFDREITDEIEYKNRNLCFSELNSETMKLERKESEII